MGNLITKNLQLKIDVTKQDISQSYDLTTIEGVIQVNQELINSFSDFSKNDIKYVKLKQNHRSDLVGKILDFEYGK